MLPVYHKNSKKFLLDTVGLGVQHHDLGAYRFTCPRNLFPSFYFYSATRTFTINVVDEINEITIPIPHTSFPHAAYAIDTNQYVIVCNTPAIECLSLDCDTAYHFDIGDLRSETFFVSNDMSNYTRVDIKNGYNIGLIPFQTGFTATFWVFMPIDKFLPKLYQESEIIKGKKTVTKTVNFDTFSRNLIKLPKYLADNIVLTTVCDVTILTYNGVVYNLTNGDISIGDVTSEYFGSSLTFGFDTNYTTNDCRLVTYTSMPLEILPFVCPPESEIVVEVNCASIPDLVVVVTVTEE